MLADILPEAKVRRAQRRLKPLAVIHTPPRACAAVSNPAEGDSTVSESLPLKWCGSHVRPLWRRCAQ